MMFRFPSVICTRCTGFFCLAIIKGPPNDSYCIIEEPSKHYFTEKVSYSLSCNPAPSPAAYKKPQTTVLLYTSEQLKIFLNAVYSSSCPHRLEFLLALFCGLHTGEILGLTYKDFTPCTRVLEIHHQYIKNKQLQKYLTGCMNS